MDGGPLNLLSLNLQIALRRHGWLPIGALLLIAGALILHFVLTPSFKTRTSIMRTTLTTLRTNPAPESANSLLLKRRAAFIDRLAARDDRTDIIKALFAQGKETGLKLSNGEYQFNCEASGSYCTLRLALPVKGPYLQVRNFARGVLEKIPSAAIEEISFRRDGIKMATVDARIKFAIHMKADD
jgi:hypothetical protein